MHPYHENLTVRRVPVFVPAVFPRYFELGPLSVEPTQAGDITAVDLRYQPRSQALSAGIVRLSHFRLVKRSLDDIHTTDLPASLRLVDNYGRPM